LKWFFFSGAGRDRLAGHGFAEQYRNGHKVGASLLTGWVESQPVELLPWSFISGGVSAEVLNSLLQPIKDEKAVRFVPRAREENAIPSIPLELLRVRFRWLLANPKASNGGHLSASSFHAYFPRVARALERVNNAPSRFGPSTIDERMSCASASIPFDDPLPRVPSEDDPTAFTLR
jgi:hypothetical protein